jgi:hypothetical protein
VLLLVIQLLQLLQNLRHAGAPLCLWVPAGGHELHIAAGAALWDGGTPSLISDEVEDLADGDALIKQALPHE